MDTYGVDTSLKGNSRTDTIINLKAESLGEAYWKSQVKKGQLLRNSSSMSVEGYSVYQDEDSSTQGMFTPSPDDFGRNGECIRVCKSTHMYFLYPFFRTIIPQIKYINPLMGHVIP